MHGCSKGEAVSTVAVILQVAIGTFIAENFELGELVRQYK
jgi:hypothetical protein